MSVDPTSDNPKKRKPTHLEFDFDASLESKPTSASSPSSHAEEEPKRESLNLQESNDKESKKSIEPSQPSEPSVLLKPFGKPISSHFETTKPTQSPSEGLRPPAGGTVLGAFKPQSTVIPSKSIAPTDLSTAKATPTVPTASAASSSSLPSSIPSSGTTSYSAPLSTSFSTLTPPPTETPMSSPTPSMSDFRRNAERQSREQQTTGNILSGIAYALLAAILLVASLAGFGGYVMWRQIKNQATTVAQLSDKLSNEVATLREEAAQAHKAIDDNFRRQQEQINKLTANAEQQRALFAAEQKKKDAAIQALQGNLKRLENRLGPIRQ